MHLPIVLLLLTFFLSGPRVWLAIDALYAAALEESLHEVLAEALFE